MIFTQSVANGYQAYLAGLAAHQWCHQICKHLFKMMKVPITFMHYALLTNQMRKEEFLNKYHKAFLISFSKLFSFQSPFPNFTPETGRSHVLPVPHTQQQHLWVPCYYSLWYSKDFWAHYYRTEHNSVFQCLIMVTAACFQDAFTLWKWFRFSGSKCYRKYSA